jgi:hypothetical protein
MTLEDRKNRMPISSFRSVLGDIDDTLHDDSHFAVILSPTLVTTIIRKSESSTEIPLHAHPSLVLVHGGWSLNSTIVGSDVLRIRRVGAILIQGLIICSPPVLGPATHRQT